MMSFQQEAASPHLIFPSAEIEFFPVWYYYSEIVKGGIAISVRTCAHHEETGHHYGRSRRHRA
jgi:hypothetical protein